MKITLKEIANIQTGLFAKTVTGGKIVYLQAKDFDENGKLKSKLHPDLMEGEIAEKHLLKADDVLFAAKGTKNFAAVYESHNPPCVASTTFFVIRLHDQRILAEYLTWYINNPNTQKLLKGKAMGSSIASISKTVLEELEVSIPDLKTQQAIVKISELRQKEKELMQQIDKLKEIQIQQRLWKILDGK